MEIHIIGWLLELFNNGLIINWGTTGYTGTYWGTNVTFPCSYTEVPVVIGTIYWSWSRAWYVDSTNVQGRGVTDVTGTPYDISLTGFGIQSFSMHKWVAFGY